MASQQQTTNSELKEMLSDVLRIQAELARKVDTVSTEVKHLGNRLLTLEASLETSQNSISSDISTRSQELFEQIHESIAATVCFCSPMNVMFYGIHSNPKSTLDALIRNFMFETLSVAEDRANNMAIHVQCLPKMSQDDVHSPICVSFRSYKDIEHVRKKADKNKAKLRELGVWIKGSNAGTSYWKTERTGTTHTDIFALSDGLSDVHKVDNDETNLLT